MKHISGFSGELQDLGRFGHTTVGVPISGAMDQAAMREANALVGNLLGVAVLESAIMGGRFQFTEHALVAITGTFSDARLNDAPCLFRQAFVINPGDELFMGIPREGRFTYLAIAGGFISNTVLGSSSHYSPVSSYNGIGICFQYTAYTGSIPEYTNDFRFPSTTLPLTLDAYPGPEFHLLDKRIQSSLSVSSFTCKNFSRMGCILSPRFSEAPSGITSAPVRPGTVQLTPDGNLIILMRDAQTTGGYARVLQLTEDSINTLAQVRNQEIKFHIK